VSESKRESKWVRASKRVREKESESKWVIHTYNQCSSFTHEINTQSLAHTHAYTHQIWSKSKHPIIQYNASNAQSILNFYTWN